MEDYMIRILTLMEMENLMLMSSTKLRGCWQSSERRYKKQNL